MLKSIKRVTQQCHLCSVPFLRVKVEFMMLYVNLVFVLTVSTFSYAQSNQFANPSINRDIQPSSGFAVTYREQLKDIRQHCLEVDNLKKLSMPLNHNLKTSKRFMYYFQHNIVNAIYPTIVYLPGGPGATSIGTNWGVNFNTLYIDPRGTGCNYGSNLDFPENLMNTYQHVLDVYEILKHLNLENYILYGKSYGTVVATQLAHVLKNIKEKPKAVILEGVVGKAYRGADSWTANFAGVANKFLNQNTDIQSFFRSVPRPLDYESGFWANYLTLAFDQWGQYRSNLSRLIQHVNGGTLDPDVLRYFSDEHRYYQESKISLPIELEEEPGDYVMYSIGCREIGEQTCGNRFLLDFANGEVVTVSTNFLFSPTKYSGIQMDMPYDSMNYEIPFPLYYFQGDLDPATNIEGALYHFQHQLSNRHKNSPFPIVFQSFSKKGHSPLMNTLREFPSCWNKVIKSVFMLKPNLSDALTVEGICTD